VRRGRRHAKQRGCRTMARIIPPHVFLLADAALKRVDIDKKFFKACVFIDVGYVGVFLSSVVAWRKELKTFLLFFEKI
jgi:hypothetical protein